MYCEQMAWRFVAKVQGSLVGTMHSMSGALVLSGGRGRPGQHNRLDSGGHMCQISLAHTCWLHLLNAKRVFTKCDTCQLSLVSAKQLMSTSAGSAAAHLGNDDQTV